MDGPPPPLDPSLAPVLLFDRGRGGAELEEASTKLVYSIPKRQLLPAAKALDPFVHNVNWITPQGWLLTLDHGTRDAFLRSPFTSRTVRLPRDEEGLLPSSKDDRDATRCFLSTRRPTDPGCVVLVVHRTEPTFYYCRAVGSSSSGSRWYKHAYRPEEIDQDRDNVIRSMASLVGAAGKFYAHLVDNKVVTLEFSPDPTFTAVRVRGRQLPLGGCYVTYCRLLESCGDLFTVKFWYTPFSERRILCVRVQKLDWSTGAWVKVTGLGVNMAFFVHSSIGTSMAADELGLKADCIYFTKDDDKGLYVHDLEQGTTTSHDPGPDIPSSLEPTLLVLAGI